MSKSKYFIRWTSNRVGSKTNVSFIPAETINCNPPYMAGKRDSCYARVDGVDCHDKEASERAIGMRLLPID